MHQKSGKIYGIIMMISLMLLCGCEAPSLHSITRMRFDHFLDQCLKAYGDSDAFSLHFRLEDPDSYNIKEESLPSFPDISEEQTEADLDTARDLLKKLNSFHKNVLTEDQQLIADLLENNLNLTIDYEEKYPYYTSVFGSGGTIASLASSLGEYSLEDEHDVEEYFRLLEDLPDYLTDLVSYEKTRADKGIAPSQTEVSDTLNAIDTFLDGDVSQNSLCTSFSERIQKLSTDESGQDIASLTDKNTALLTDTVLPAYQKIRDEISEEFADADGPEVICQYENGQDYYNFLLKYKVGIDQTAKECEEILLDMYQDARDDESSLLKDHPGLSDDYYSALPELTDAKDILNLLRKNTLIYFPAIDDISYEVKNSEDSVFSQNTAAYYITPPYGYTGKQTIYLNPLATDDSNLFTTLAHEGYPGHLYQVNYFYENLTHPIQLYLTCNGYDEGWGIYAQLYSYNCLTFSSLDHEVSENVKQLMKDNTIMSSCLCSLCDLYANYEGENEEDVISWMENQGVTSESASSIFDYVTEHPTAYLSYSMGYYEIISLQEEAERQDHYSIEKFHKSILSCGSCPFYILKDYVK